MAPGKPNRIRFAWLKGMIMNTRTTLSLLAALALVSSAAAQTTRPSAPDVAGIKHAETSPRIHVSLKDAAIGSLPADFITARTGQGDKGEWVVMQDDEATDLAGANRVLVQKSADQTSYRFPLCLVKDFSAKDVQVTACFKAVSGKVDQAAGLVVRYQDSDNYYIARANALENNVRLYKVVAGKRIELAGKDLPVSAGAWHMLTLKVVGSRLQVFHSDIEWMGHPYVNWNPPPLLEADDSTFANAGRVGLWTKADSVTEFTGLLIEPLTAK